MYQSYLEIDKVRWEGKDRAEWSSRINTLTLGPNPRFHIHTPWWYREYRPSLSLTQIYENKFPTKTNEDWHYLFPITLDCGKLIGSMEEYRRSKHWKNVRESFHLQCAACGWSSRISLHHKTYERLGRETVDDLVPLCANCHKLVHFLCDGELETHTDDIVERISTGNIFSTEIMFECHPDWRRKVTSSF